ncbi:hypothetical protein O181_001492 [Austropuccinia psidii MF-1]|uniref:Uncharacterized protein n=1 Tax=Austropuccinia psidii MF-1 TaxID=1389203 RepID=A0A9Q3BAX5_9BASI|nr:hypothetical protein [Austropuccinia psidii MF-1]
MFPGIEKTTPRSLGQDDEEEEINSVEEEDSVGTEVAPALVKESQGNGGLTISQSNQPVSNKYEPSFLAIMKQILQIMAKLQ